VKHEGNVNRPVDAVAIEVKAVDHLENNLKKLFPKKSNFASDADYYL
jgi:hypothetical protein